MSRVFCHNEGLCGPAATGQDSDELGYGLPQDLEGLASHSDDLFELRPETVGPGLVLSRPKLIGDGLNGHEEVVQAVGHGVTAGQDRFLAVRDTLDENIDDRRLMFQKTPHLHGVALSGTKTLVHVAKVVRDLEESLRVH